ncbi:unnamed protein product [Linum trigynum]|uniref:Uncharacterized protein n=1 Tax=Linum trigynum TaxID=586398 RepID=A0AAV2DXB1_9ROSI
MCPDTAAANHHFGKVFCLRAKYFFQSFSPTARLRDANGLSKTPNFFLFDLTPSLSIATAAVATTTSLPPRLRSLLTTTFSRLNPTLRLNASPRPIKTLTAETNTNRHHAVSERCWDTERFRR